MTAAIHDITAYPRRPIGSVVVQPGQQLRVPAFDLNLDPVALRREIDLIADYRARRSAESPLYPISHVGYLDDLDRDFLETLPIIGGAAPSAWLFTNGGRTKLLDGTFDLDSDSFKVALHTSSSNIGASSVTWGGGSPVTNEVAAANGYTAGGIAVTLALSGTTTVAAKFASNPVWTASGGTIVARFAVLYEVAGNVLAYCTLDSAPADVTTQDATTFTIDGTTNGVLTLA